MGWIKGLAIPIHVKNNATEGSYSPLMNGNLMTICSIPNINTPVLHHLQDSGHGNTTAAAQSGQPQGLPSLFHGIEQGHHNAASG